MRWDWTDTRTHIRTLSVLPVLCCLKASCCNVTLTASLKSPSQRESVANWKSASNIFSPKGSTHQNNHILPWANQAENAFRGQTKLITRLLSATALNAKIQSRFPRFQQAEFRILWFISSAVFYNLWCMFNGSLWDLCNILLCVCEPVCSFSSLLGLENHRRPVNLNERENSIAVM